jgi:hypothetical protein
VPALLLMVFSPLSGPAHWAGVYLAAGLLTVASVTFWYAYVRRIALRVPSEGLAFESLLLICGWGITALFTWVLPALGTLLFYAGIHIGDVYSFPSGTLAFVIAAALRLYSAYFCFRLRRDVLAGRSLATSRRAGEATAGAD